MGNAPYLEMLVVRLAAPSLQHLDADVWGGSPIFPIPNLCKFIRDTECQFTAVRVDLLQWKLTFSAETCPISDHAQPFRITIPESVSLELIGNALSGPLSTVEELVIGWDVARPTQERAIQWRGFFNHIPTVKMVQMASDVALDVAHSFQLDGHESTMDLLPTLEHIKV